MDFEFEHDIYLEMKMFEHKGYLSEELNCNNKFGTAEKQLRQLFYGGYIDECRREYYLGDTDPSPVSINTSGRNNGKDIQLAFKYEFGCVNGLHFRRLDYNIEGQKGSIEAKSINLLPSFTELIQLVQTQTSLKTQKSIRIIKDDSNQNRGLKR